MTQAEALDILKTGANVFLTGEPGSGKTHTINNYIAYLRDHDLNPAITASTGLAATHLGGVTIHAWSGIGVKTRLSPYDLDLLSQNKKLVERVKAADVLIIDEISMLAAGTLELVNQVCQELRHSEEAFGGLQVIFVGDFFQLPPVTKERGTAPSFAYEAPVWSQLKLFICYLSEQHRQADAKFLTILSAIRCGQVGSEHRNSLNTRLVKNQKILTTNTRLFPHNADVDKLNELELQKLSGAERIFTMKTKGAPPLVEQLKRNCLSPEILKLKVGARVMFTKNNTEERFVNGTLGVIKSFRRTDNYPVVKTTSGQTITVEPAEWLMEHDGKPVARLWQMPLRLAWAITVHKSQGISLDEAVIDLSQAFEYGQGYVALSRVRTLSGLHLSGWNERALKVHPQILAQDSQFREQSRQVRLAFQKISRERLQAMQQNFLRAKGGVIF